MLMTTWMYSLDCFERILYPPSEMESKKYGENLAVHRVANGLKETLEFLLVSISLDLVLITNVTTMF